MGEIQTINSLARGLQILDILYDHGQIGATELGMLLGINKSSAYRLLITLVHEGYAEQIGDSGKYKLGMKLAKFKSRVLDTYEIHSIIHPYLIKLTQLTGEASGFSVMKGDKAILIDKCSSPQHIGVNLTVGMEEEMNCTAHGKALLSSFTEEEQRRLISKQNFVRHTTKTLVEIEDILADAKKNAELGYAIDDEENAEGMRCIASNVYDYSGKVVGCIGISCPVERVKLEKLIESINTVKDIALEFSRKLGY